MLDNPNLRWCPAAGCLNAVYAKNLDRLPVKCDCGYSFWYGEFRFLCGYLNPIFISFQCGRDPHLPILCEYLQRWLKKCDDDSETSNWIHCNTKVEYDSTH